MRFQFMTIEFSFPFWVYKPNIAQTENPPTSSSIRWLINTLTDQYANLFSFIKTPRNVQPEYFNWLQNTYAPYLFRQNHQDSQWQLQAASPLLQQRASPVNCPAKCVLSKHTNLTDCYSVKSGSNWLLWYSKDQVWRESKHIVGAGNWPLSASTFGGSSSLQGVRDVISDLKKRIWFDGHTRRIQNQFVMINKPAGLYSFFQLDIRIPVSGYADVKSIVNVFPISIRNPNLQYFGYFCMALLTVVLLVMAWKTMRSASLMSLTEFWFLQKLLFILLCLASLTLQVYDIVTVQEYTEELHAGNIGEVPYGITVNLSKQLFGVAMFLLLIRVCLMLFLFFIPLYFCVSR